MARRPNYGFQKRQKELKRQQKKEAKAEQKRLRKEGAQAEADQPSVAGEAAAEEEKPADA